MNINPYKVLGVVTTASPLEIKRTYKRLSLQHHPDKVQQKGGQVDTTLFQQIQFAYSILSDPAKRLRYDTTGLTGSASESEVFDWKEYFLATTDKITLDMIDEDRARYQGSAEERDDILHNFAFYEGDFLKLFEVVPHLEFDEPAEARVFQIIEDGISEDSIALDKTTRRTWDKYKKLRKTKVRQQLKKLAREALQAAALATKLGLKCAANESDLKAMIQRTNAGSMDGLIANLEAKYGGNKRDLPDDEEFERIQEKMTKKRRRA